MLITRQHWRWWIACGLGTVISLVLYALFARTATPEGAFGGTTAGLWFGIAAGLGMLAAAFLAVRKKFIVTPTIPGSARFWLHVHLWVGSLALLWTFLHTGFRFGGPFEQLLMAVWLFVAFTGFFGLIIQQYLPRLMTNTVRAETFAQQVPILCRRLLVEADWLTAEVTGTLLVRHDVPEEDVLAVFDELKAYFKEYPDEDGFRTHGIKKVEDFVAFVYRGDDDPESAQVPTQEETDVTDSMLSGEQGIAVAVAARVRTEGGSTTGGGESERMATRLRTFYRNVVRPYLRDIRGAHSPLNGKSTADVQFDSLKSPLPPQLARAAERIERICDVRRQYGAQGRLLWWLHSWLYLHVPASMVLLVLFLWHVVLALRVVPPAL